MRHIVDGKPIPNPDYPQDIQNVEGRSCRNLFNPMYLSIEEGYNTFDEQTGLWTTNSGSSYNRSIFQNATGSSSVRDINKLPKLATGEYTIKFNDFVNNTGSSSFLTYAIYDNTGTIIGETTSINTDVFTINVAQESYIDLRRYAPSGTFSFSSIQINEGSTALPYEPYFEGKRLEFNVCNKNLFNLPNASGSLLGINYELYNQQIKLNGTGTSGRYPWIVITKNGVRTHSSTPNAQTFISDADGTILASGAGVKQLQVLSGTSNYELTLGLYNENGNLISSLTENTKIMVAALYLGNNKTYTNYTIGLQLEKGTVATEYMPHKQQTILFPLAEGQKLMEGDYLAADGVHHISGQIVLDGNQLMSKFNYNSALSTADYNCFFFTDNSIKQASNDTGVFVIANKLLGTPAGQRTSNKLNCWINHLAAHLLGIHVPNAITDTTELRAWLTNNPITFEYVLEEEVIDPYTEAQQEAYNKLKKLMLNQGVNHIWCETEGLEPNLQLTYYKSNKNRLNNIEARLELLEG